MESDEEENVLGMVSAVTELNELSKYLNDPDVDYAMDKLVKLIARPNVEHRIVAPLIVNLQALSVKFNLQSKYYMLYSVDKEEKTKKKNTYASLSDGLEKLANALKYLVKD